MSAASSTVSAREAVMKFSAARTVGSISARSGSLSAGITTVWLNPQSRPGRPDIPPDYTIRALAELPAILESL